MSIPDMCRAARVASRAVATLTTDEKNAALERVAHALEEQAGQVAQASARDVEDARTRGVSEALLDRLRLDEARVRDVAASVRAIAKEHDPVGDVLEDRARPNGLRVRLVRVPLGVIAMVYEARPNVTVEAAALCFKAGNAVLLRGGSDAARTNALLGDVVRSALPDAVRDAMQVVPGTSRDAILELIQAEGAVDLVIPRGGEALIRFVSDNARVPVVQHFKGVCHLYVDGSADVAEATRIAVNGKLSRPGVCNALECLLVDEGGADRILPPMAKALLDGGCELRGCERTLAVLGTVVSGVKPAKADDWGREFLDRVLAVRVVRGQDGALDHIAQYGSGHTEAICTSDEAQAERFRREVDAACVVVNASTRFHDGGELGLGAEIGIATSRLHWRGPMGLEALTTMKWIVDGHGQVR